MRRLNLFVGALAIVALASCSNDEVVSNVESAQLAQQSIGFSPLTKGISTRGIVSAAADIPDFAVTAYLATALDPSKDYYLGSKTPVQFSSDNAIGDVYDGMQNIVIKNNSGAFDYANASDTKYWPYIMSGSDYVLAGTKLDFVAISPASLAGNGFTPANTGGKLEDYTPGTDDVLFAVNTGRAQADGAVPMQFKHLLSQIIFKAKKASGMNVDIQSITLANVPNKGTWTASAISGQNVTAAWTTTFATTPADKTDYAGGSGSVTAVDNDDAQQLTATGSEILIIPQDASQLAYNPTLVGTTDTDSKAWAVETKATTDDHFNTGDDNNRTVNKGINKLFLKVTLRVQNATGDYTLGSATTYDEIYYSVNTNWEAGKKYIYTLLFGGVKGDNGNTGSTTPDITGGTYNDGAKPFTSTPITFTADVDDWVDADKNVAF